MIRKLVAWDDFSKVATLNLHDKATRDEIFLTICDVNANSFSFSQEYTSFSSKAHFPRRFWFLRKTALLQDLRTLVNSKSHFYSWNQLGEPFLKRRLCVYICFSSEGKRKIAWRNRYTDNRWQLTPIQKRVLQDESIEWWKVQKLLRCCRCWFLAGS